MPTEPVRESMLVAAVRSWRLLDGALLTTDAPRLWAEHWALVVRLRRRYRSGVAVVGVLYGALAGFGVYVLADLSGQWPTAIVLVLASVVLARYARRLQRRTVAPFVLKRRHVLTVLCGVLLCWAVFVAALFVEPGPVWAVAAGVLAGLPWWLGAYRESATAAAPDFPAEWREFLTE